MLKTWLWRIFVVLLLFVAFLLATAPARLLPLALHALSPDIRLQHAEGSLWNGRVASALITVEGGVINLGKVSWTVKPQSLLLLSPTVSIHSDAGVQRLNAEVTVSLLGQRVEVKHIDGQFPLAVLEPWVPLLIRGMIELDIERLAFDDRRLLAVEGRLYAHQLDWMAASHPLSLGSYIADLSLAGDDLQLALSDRQAALGVDGMLLISPAGSYRLDVRLGLTEQLAPEVKNAVVFLGKRAADGSVQVNNVGRWR